MTETEQEDEAVAKQAYAIWRGSYRGDEKPEHWDDAGEAFQEMLRFVVAHARHFEIARRDSPKPQESGSKEPSR